MNYHYTPNKIILIYFSQSDSKSLKKNRPRFLKMDILKMSIFEKLGVNVSEKFILLDNAVNSKKIIQILLA